MKHTIAGAFTLEQIKEITKVLEVQETTERATSTIISYTGEYGEYLITINDEGSCIVV